MIRAALYLLRFLRGYRVCDVCGDQLPPSHYAQADPGKILWVCGWCQGRWVGGECADCREETQDGFG